METMQARKDSCHEGCGRMQSFAQYSKDRKREAIRRILKCSGLNFAGIIREFTILL